MSKIKPIPKKVLLEKHPYEIAQIIIEMEKKHQFGYLSKLPVTTIEEILEYLPEEMVYEFLIKSQPNRRHHILEVWDIDELRDFIHELDEHQQEEILKLVSGNKKDELVELLAYQKDTAASIMSTDFLIIRETMTIPEATSMVISEVKEEDHIDEIFVIDEEDRWIGFIELKDLLIARAEDQLASVIQEGKIYCHADDAINRAIQKMRKYDVNVLPVLDRHKQLLGIITSDEALEMMIEDYDDDVKRLVAVGEYDEDSGPVTRMKQRIIWLIASIVLNLAIAAFLIVFQTTIESVATLILFQPMILGMAGNIGTQSIAVTILKIHHEGMDHPEKIKFHIGKEMLIGLTNSLIIGVAGFLVSWMFLSFTGNPDIYLPLVVGISLVGGMFISSIAGVFIPVLLAKLKIDPAAASGPIISTINDLFALVIYFGIATLLLL